MQSQREESAEGSKSSAVLNMMSVIAPRACEAGLVSILISANGYEMIIFARNISTVWAGMEQGQGPGLYQSRGMVRGRCSGRKSCDRTESGAATGQGQIMYCLQPKLQTIIGIKYSILVHSQLNLDSYYYIFYQ